MLLLESLKYTLRCFGALVLVLVFICIVTRPKDVIRWIEYALIILNYINFIILNLRETYVNL